MDFLYSVWWKTYKINHKGLNINLQGNSVAGRYSGFWISDWKVMLDAGLQSSFNPDYIFITHPHSDHIDRLTSVLTDISSKPNIYIPYGCKPFVKDYLEARYRMTSMDENFVWDDSHYTLIECRPGDMFEVEFKKKRFQVKVFQTDHTINSVGYAFSEYRNKRKPEYADKTYAEMKQMSLDGVKATEYVPIEQLIYTGDTTNTIFDQAEKDGVCWDRYRVIMTECTFIKELSPAKLDVEKRACDKGHNYLEAIEKTAAKYPTPLFLLCHWSLRYDPIDIQELFDRKNYSNIQPYLNRFDSTIFDRA